MKLVPAFLFLLIFSSQPSAYSQTAEKSVLVKCAQSGSGPKPADPLCEAVLKGNGPIRDCTPTRDGTGPEDPVCEALLRHVREGADVLSYLDAERFRLKFPAPSNLLAMIETYNRANAILLERAKQGLRNEVFLFNVDGITGEGFDEIFTSSPRQLHEVRPDHESIVMGDINCTRQTGQPFKCEKMDMNIDEFNLGLRELIPASIISIDEALVSCGEMQCKSYEIVQGEGDDILGKLTITQEPHLNHKAYTLVVLPDGAPFSFKEFRRVKGEIENGEVLFRYSYGMKVAPIKLPLDQISLN